MSPALALVLTEPENPALRPYASSEMVDVPPAAVEAWMKLSGALSRVRPIFAANYAVAHRLAASPDDLDAIAIAASEAAAAIRGL